MCLLYVPAVELFDRFGEGLARKGLRTSRSLWGDG
jgi:hypothetical protein